MSPKIPRPNLRVADRTVSPKGPMLADGSVLLVGTWGLWRKSPLLSVMGSTSPPGTFGAGKPAFIGASGQMQSQTR